MATALKGYDFDFTRKNERVELKLNWKIIIQTNAIFKVRPSVVTCALSFEFLRVWMAVET